MADVNKAKKRLAEALKEKIPRYWELMKNWYKRKISKDEFDSRAKSLLGGGGIQLHNEFLFAILVKCQTISTAGDSQLLRPIDTVESTTVKVAKQPKISSPVNITPFGVLDSFQYYDPPQALSAGKDLDCLLLCSHELLLPDLPTMHTRMLLGAWEEGLESVSEEAAELLLYAVQHFLKSVITACIAQHSGWQHKSGGFQHSFGHGFLSNSDPAPPAQPPCDRNLELESMHLTSRKTFQRRLSPITLFHLRNTLQVQGTCVPSHSVRSCWRERVLSAMWHPSREEEEQKRTVQEWQQSLHATPDNIMQT